MIITVIKKNISEKAMVDAFFQSGHFRTTKLYAEVPVFSRCVDAVALNTKKQITAIEFKKEKWKEAINQVLRVSTSFDYLEICIFEPKHKELKEDILSFCSELGIGVYFMNPLTMKVKKVLLSKKNKALWKKQKREILKYLEDK